MRNPLGEAQFQSSLECRSRQVIANSFPVGVPPGDNITYTETAADGKQITFNFDRLGVRVPTLLISPWVRKGSLQHRGINNGEHVSSLPCIAFLSELASSSFAFYAGLTTDMQYTHTSILGFVAELWNLPKLTPRVEWSATFEHVIESSPRSDADCILNLPEPANF